LHGDDACAARRELLDHVASDEPGGARDRHARGSAGLARPRDGERPVEEGQVLGAAHEGRAGGPVDGIAVVEADRGEALAEGQDVADRDRQPATPQHPGERDGQLLGRRAFPIGCRAPVTGARPG
jgi:hypothetical protein